MRNEVVLKMRTIQVSADLYAAIWKQQMPGEVSEEEILRRVLNVALGKPSGPPRQAALAARGSGATVGFYDRRYGVTFPAEFEIFRVYLGQEYRAHAIGGLWCRNDDGEAYPSLNQLSNSLGANENAWDNWYYLDDVGESQPISKLRDPNKVHRRRRLSRST
jgi:hypothetical protein